MSEEEKLEDIEEKEKTEAEEVRICVTIPTKEGVKKKIKELFPSAKVEEEETTKTEE